MMRYSRGAALVETALSVGLVLMLVLATAQMGMIGFTQITADGAAFIAAHAASADPNATPQAVAHSVFGNIAAANIVPTPAPGFAKYVVTQSVAGFPLPPGVASSYTITGSDVELRPSPPPGNAPSYSFGANAVLRNYCLQGTVCGFPSAHTMHLAQTIVPGGNGINGQFQEWGCHDQYFEALLSDFPSTRPEEPPQAGTALDMTTPGTDEYKIYSWDNGTPCS